MAKFRQFRNVYNNVIRASKKIFYHSLLSKNRKKPKKIWELLKEVAIGSKPKKKIVVQGNTISDPKQIAENFNEFFTKQARKYLTLSSQLKN